MDTNNYDEKIKSAIEDMINVPYEQAAESLTVTVASMAVDGVKVDLGKLKKVTLDYDTVNTTASGVLNIIDTYGNIKSIITGLEGLKGNEGTHQYNEALVEMTNGILGLAETAVGYVPMVGSFLSMQIGIARNALEVGVNLINKRNAQIEAALKEVESVFETKDDIAAEIAELEKLAFTKEDKQMIAELQTALAIVKDVSDCFKEVDSSGNAQPLFDEQIASMNNIWESFNKSTGATITSVVSASGERDIVITTSSSGILANKIEELKAMYDDTAQEDAENARPIDPIVIDFNKNNKFATSLADGANFDHEGDGFKEKTAWIENEDAFLVLDQNNNGLIDDGSELFGDQTLLADGSKANNGFEALAQYDSNKNGKIDIEDEIFSNLQMWFDKNGDGITNVGELVSLGDIGVKEINLNNSLINKNDGNGNVIAREGSLVLEDGTVISLGEMNFDSDPMDTVQSNPVKIDPEIAQTMPELLAPGEVRSLRQAMTLDEGLVTLVKEFESNTDPQTREQLVHQILAKWTGSEDVVAGSRGAYIDAVQLSVIEKFYGREFNGVSGANPNRQAGPILARTYESLVKDIECKLMAQTHLYAHVFYTDIVTDEVTGRTSIDYTRVVQLFEKNASVDMKNSHNLLMNYVAFLKNSDYYKSSFSVEDMRLAFKDSSIESAIDIAFTDNTILGTAECEYLFGTAQSDLIYAGDGNDVIEGRGGNDIIYGEDGHDEIDAGDGNDTIFGGNGNDIILGGNGNDIISGGKGFDVLDGGSGKNTYMFSRWDSSDVIRSSSYETSEIKFKDVAKDDVTLIVDPSNSNNLLIVSLKSDDIITVENYFATGGIRNIDFSDGISIDREGISNWILNNTAILGKANMPNMLLGAQQDDVIMGGRYADQILGYGGDDKLFGWDGSDYINGNDGNDMLNGGNGDDALFGENGNDVLIGGKGDDYLYGGSGNDTYIFNVGDGKDIISEYDSTAGNFDVINIRDDFENILFDRVGSDLVITNIASDDRITIQSHYINDAFRVESIVDASGNAISSANIDVLIQAITAFENDQGILWEDAVRNKVDGVNDVLANVWIKETA